MHAMINSYLVLNVYIDDGVRVWVGHWRGFKFQFARGFKI